jgi:3-hydroxyisobutyrate dehydrogenase-like beta-hydroxyacid dehydrogenase
VTSNHRPLAAGADLCEVGNEALIPFEEVEDMQKTKGRGSLPAVGFVGLGAMGRPMASRLLANGYPLTAYDIVPAATERLASAGAQAATSPEAVAEASDVIVSMLPDSPDVQAAVLGSGGILAGMRESAVLIDMSTISPAVTRQVAEAVTAAGRRMLDVPVGRTPRHAAEGDLLLMAGGDPDLLEEVGPILRCFGKDLVHCGPVGSGAIMKLVNNLLGASILAADAEALVLGVAAGLELETVLAVLRSTGASNTHLRSTYPEKALRRDLSPGFATRLAIKDVRLALELASEVRLPIGVGAAALQLFNAAAAEGHENDDYTSVLAVLERYGKVELHERPAPNERRP